MADRCAKHSLCWDGKLPDESNRCRPKSLVIRQGLHPRPGPTIYDCGFDDSDGGECAGDEQGLPDVSGDEDWNDEPVLGEHNVEFEPGSTIEDMAWSVLMQPPAADDLRRGDLYKMGCSYEVFGMNPNLRHQVWNDPDASEDGMLFLLSLVIPRMTNFGK